MFNNTKRLITVILRKLRGEDFEKITLKGNEQIEKLKKVAQNKELDAIVAGNQAVAARNFAVQMDQEQAKLNKEAAKAKVLKKRFENIFTVTDEDLEEV